MGRNAGTRSERANREDVREFVQEMIRRMEEQIRSLVSCRLRCWKRNHLLPQSLCSRVHVGRYDGFHVNDHRLEDTASGSAHQLDKHNSL